MRIYLRMKLCCVISRLFTVQGLVVHVAPAQTGAGCTKGEQRYPPDSDFFNRRKNASRAIKLLISNS